MTDVRHEIGRHGEDIAARYLQESGYRLIQRNYRCSLGELIWWLKMGTIWFSLSPNETATMPVPARGDCIATNHSIDQVG